MGHRQKQTTPRALAKVGAKNWRLDHAQPSPPLAHVCGPTKKNKYIKHGKKPCPKQAEKRLRPKHAESLNTEVSALCIDGKSQIFRVLSCDTSESQLVRQTGLVVAGQNGWMIAPRVRFGGH